MYAAKKGFDDTCMYLGLRSGNIDMEDVNGKNIF
jgi:hypothetical protein